VDAETRPYRSSAALNGHARRIPVVSPPRRHPMQSAPTRRHSSDAVQATAASQCGVLRAAYLSFYAACAALGTAAVARPALLSLRALTQIRSVPAPRLLFGSAFALLGVAIAATALWLSLDVALTRRRSLPRHAALLVLTAIAIALRSITEPAR
jgi:hypothetical protein